MALEAPRNEEKGKSRFEVKWYHNIGDFANLFKAFIGTNYLTLAYGLKQSGLGAGLVVFVVIALLTNHCCGLIVKCKHLVIDDLCYKVMYKHRDSGASPGASREESSGELATENVTLLRRRLMKSLNYADIGKLTWGKYGSFVVNLFLVITQMGFCVNYYIFIGNTMYGLFPMEATGLTGTSELADLQNSTVGFSTSSVKDDEFRRFNSSVIDTTEFPTITDIKNITDNIETMLPTFSSTISGSNSTNSSDIVPTDMVSSAPALSLLVLVPMPIFILFTLFRNIRQMSLVSVAANIACLVGFFSVVIYILIDFHVDDTLEWFRLATLPILIGQLTASYEAIGTIIPIESSMEGNQHNFTGCLHSVILVFSALIATSSIIGYLNYGEATQQIITQNLPSDDIMVIVINVTLMVGILCTYPLQIFPVIEILEFNLFGKGKIFGHARKVTRTSGEWDENHPLLSSTDSHTDDLGLSHSIAMEVPSQVPAWKRNIFRAAITILIGGLAVLFRNVFAYFNSFIGAVGSAPLAFILPCLFHFTIVRHTASAMILTKDIVIAIIGLAFGVVGIVVTIQEMVTKL